MTKDEFSKEKLYQVSLIFLRNLLNKGLINLNEFKIANEKIKAEYNPIIGDFLLD